MSRRNLSVVRAVAAGVRRVPFTLSFLGVMVAANWLADTLSGQIDPVVLAARGIGLDAMRDGDLTRFTTAIFLSHDLPMLLRQLPFAAVVIGLAEWRWGSWRAAGVFFGIDLAATVTLLAATAWVPGLGMLAGVTDVGMSMGGFGVIGVLAALTLKGFACLAAIFALVALKYALSPAPLADLGHVIALLIGFCVGLVAGRSRSHS